MTADACLTYFVATTLDGFIAHPDGGWDGFLTDGDHLAAIEKRIRSFDVVVMGRRTYEAGLAAGLAPGQPAYPPTRQIVYSRTVEVPKTSPIEVVSTDAVAHVRELKRKTERIWLCGGAELAASLSRECLIDRLVLKLNPTTLGAGIPLFAPGGPVGRWRLDTLTRFDSGVVFLEYDRGDFTGDH